MKFERDYIVDSESVSSAKSLSSGLSTVNKYTSTGSDLTALLAALLAADKSGSTLKFSQICKLISRIRLVDINFGKELGGFLDGMGKIFDKQYSVDIETQLQLFKDKLQVSNSFGIGR